MTAVVLRASGYTWRCPECQRENYTGPAPAVARCTGCHGEFAVEQLRHRRAGTGPDNGKEVRPSEQTQPLPLFAAPPPASAEDEIPF